MRTALLAVSVAALVSVACSSSSSSLPGKPLDCGVLASDNCWKTTVAASASCLPASTETGTLSADGKTCTYASGVTVTFDQPLVLPIPTGKDAPEPTWNFTVTKNGQPCLRFENPQSTQKVTTTAGTASFGGGIGGVTLTCPDGSQFSSNQGLGLLSCDAGILGGLPGDEWSGGDTSVSFGIMGTANAPTQVFNCKK